MYVTLRDTANYKVTNSGATYDAVNGVWYFTYAGLGNVGITVGRYTEQDRVAAVAAAYTNITEKNYIVGNNFYNVSADAVSIAALKGAIENAVAAQAQREIAALGFTGVTVRAALASNPTMQAPGTVVYSGNATLTLILNGATTTVSATGINASIAYADLRATQSAIEAAFNSLTISTGTVSTAVDLLTAAGNTVPGVTMQYVKITNIANNMVQFVYRFTYGGTDSGEITAVHAVTP